MRWMTAVLMACLLVSTPALSAVSSVVTATFQSAAVATGNGTALDVSKYNSLAVQVIIATTATVTFEATVDNTNWVSLACTSFASTSATLVTSATASGLFQCNTAGLSSVRMRISAWTSGAVTVTGVLTTAVASKKGGGSGSGAPIDATYLTQTADGTLSAEQALGSLSTGCLGVTTTTGVVASRTITGTANQISVANGDCSGAPTISLPAAIDVSSKTFKLPSSTTLPATCNVGEIYMDTDATSGQRIYACQSANTWALQGDGTGGATTHPMLDGSIASDTVACTPSLGDLINGNVSNLWVCLPGNTTTTKKFLTQTGTGTVSATPGWSTIIAGDLPATAALTDASNSWSDGVKQTFNPNGTNAGINVGSNATDPSSPANGDIWYDSGNNTLDARINGATVNLGSGSGTDTFVLHFNSGGWTTHSGLMVQNTTSYLYADGMGTVAGILGVQVPANSTLTAVYWKAWPATTTGTAAQLVTHKLRKNNTTDSTGCTMDYSATVNSCNETSLSTSYSAGDYIDFKVTTPVTWTQAANAVRWSVSMIFTKP